MAAFGVGAKKDHIDIQVLKGRYQKYFKRVTSWPRRPDVPMAEQRAASEGDSEVDT